MTPKEVSSFLSEFDAYHEPASGPVLRALADLYTSAQDYREAGYTWKLMADLKRLEELQP